MNQQDFEAIYFADVADARLTAHSLVEALPGVADAVSDPELADTLKAKLFEASEQVEELHALAPDLGEPAATQSDEAIVGLIARMLHILSAVGRGPVRDTALIAALQQVQHHQIATYGTLAAYAKILGRHDEKRIFGAMLEEERATDEDLTHIAAGLLEPVRSPIAA